MIGHVMGAFSTTATLRSVIFSAEGSEARFTFDWTSAAAASASRVDVAPSATTPPTAAPIDVKKPRRSSRRATAGFMNGPRRGKAELRDARLKADTTEVRLKADTTTFASRGGHYT
jgi:hypothetical protein